VRFVLEAKDFALYDLDLRRVVEPGTYTLWAGGSSDATVSEHVTLTGATKVLAPAPPRMR
jgi:beta-glucosidase